MRWIVIKYDPYRLPTIPSTNLLHELRHVIRTLLFVERPSPSSGIDLICGEQIKEAARFLSTLQNQPLGTRITSSSIMLNRDRHLIEKQHHPIVRQLPPRQTYPRQNSVSAWIATDQLAFDATKAQPPFWSTRRKCSRLMVETTPSSSRY